MACPTRINFTPGIRKISQLVNPSVNLNARALKLIERIMVNLNEILTSECQSKLKGNKVMRVSVAENTVKQHFKGQMKILALAEGNKSMLKYHTGLLHYEPKDKRLLGVKSKEKKITKGYTEFSKGVSTLTRAAFPETSLQTRGKQLICKMLVEIAKKISDEAKADAQTCNSLEPMHIKSAVDHIMAEEMRKHAEAEGAKMIFFLESGWIVFEPPKKRATKKALVTPPKKRAAKQALVTPPVKRRRLISQKRRPVSRRKVRKTRSPKSVAAKRRRKTPSRKRKVVCKVERPVSRAKKRRVSTARKRAVKKRRVSRERKRTVSKSRAKKRRVSRARKRTVSKTRAKKQRVSRARKRTVSKTRARKRSVSRARARKRPVSREKKRVVSKARKRTVSRLKPKQKTVARKKRATPRRAVCRPRTPSRQRKPATQARRKRRVTPKKKPISARRTKAVKKEPAPSRRTPGLGLSAIQRGVKKLNATLQQSIDPAAVQLVGTKLCEFVGTISREICNDSSSNIGAREVRRVVLSLLPKELKECATARISHVATNM